MVCAVPPVMASWVVVVVVVACMVVATLAVALVWSAHENVGAYDALWHARKDDGGGIAWPFPEPAVATRARKLARLSQTQWPHIEAMFPHIEQVMEKHGKLITYAYAEALIGPLFGSNDELVQFNRSLLVLAHTIYDDTLHGSVLLNATQRESVQATVEAYGRDVWAELSKYPRTPIDQHSMSLAVGRYNAYDD